MERLRAELNRVVESQGFNDHMLPVQVATADDYVLGWVSLGNTLVEMIDRLQPSTLERVIDFLKTALFVKRNYLKLYKEEVERDAGKSSRESNFQHTEPAKTP